MRALADLGSLGGRSTEHREILWITVSGLFIAIVVALVAAFRRQARRAEAERADSVIEEEYRRLEEIRRMH